jgi:hypothetical protein
LRIAALVQVDPNEAVRFILAAVKYKADAVEAATLVGGQGLGEGRPRLRVGAACEAATDLQRGLS